MTGVRILLLLLVVAVAAAAASMVFRPRAGPPAYFDQALTYAAALERSKATGKPVFALASADWCGPCREFEAGALADGRVAAWITSNTIPLFLDVSDSKRPGAEAGAALGVTAVPAIFLITDGKPVARAEGVLSAEALLDWLARASRITPAD